jgi:uroporphyrin-III C-methyltransferase
MADTDSQPVSGSAAANANAATQARPKATLLPKVALGLAVLALGGSLLLWQQLQSARRELARRSTDTGTAVSEAREQSARAESLVQELQVRLGVAELRLSEVTLQRSQLEELMLTVSRTRDDSLVQDLESALQLAQQQALLTGSVQPLVSALQSAQARIGRAAQPRLNPVSRAIERDVERIRAAALADLPALASRIDEQIRLIDELPLLNAPVPLQADEAAPATADVQGQQPAASAGLAASASAWQRLQAWWGGWSARAWASVSASGSELVRVHRMDRPEAALLAPDQEFFLRENAKLKLLNARMALLARQSSTAAADLRSVESTLQRYFDARSRPTRLAIEALQGVQRDLSQHVQLPRPDDTLAALAAAAVGR